jgi:tape measure domain-containing protein
MNDNIIKILITAKDEASSVLAGLKNNASQAADASKKFAVGLAAAATATAGFIGYGAKIAGDLEASRAGFITLLGSAGEADKVLAQIKKDAASTPFELPGLIQANQLLTSVTKDGMRSEDMLLNVGKALAAMGKGQPELDRIIVNLQQIGAVGKASLMDVRQFAFAGIPIFEMLQETTGKSGDALSDFISEGGVTFELLEQMFEKTGSAGGRFADAFKNQAGTFNQLLSNMKDNVTVAMADIVQSSGIFDILKNAMAGVSDWVSANSGKISDGIKNMFVFIKENGTVIAGIILGALVPALASMAAGVWATLAPLLPFMAAGAVIALLLTKLADSMGGWGVLMATITPVLQQVAAVVRDALVQAFNLLMQVWQFLQPSLMALWGSLQQLFGALMNLWNFISPVLIPILQWLAIILGGLIVGAIWVLINALNIAAKVIATVINVAIGIFQFLYAVVSTVINGIIWYFNLWWSVVSYILAVIRGVFLAVWNVIGGTVTNIMSGIVNTVRGAISTVVDFFSGIWGRISGFLGNIGSGIKNAFSGAFDSVKNIASGAINWVIDKINGVIRGVNNTAGKLPGVPKISEIPRLYTGGQVTRGGFAIVGESGPEAVMLPAGAQVVSNRATQAAMASGGLGGGSTNVTINVNYNGRGQFTQSDAVDMAKQIKDALRAQGLNFDQLAALRG